MTGSNVNRFHLLVARGFAHKVALARYGSDQKIAELVREADEKKQEKYDKQMENWRLENPDSDDEKEKTGFNTKASSVQKGRSRQKKGNIVAKTERSKPPKAPRLSSHYTESMGPEVKEAVSVVAS